MAPSSISFAQRAIVPYENDLWRGCINVGGYGSAAADQAGMGRVKVNYIVIILSST